MSFAFTVISVILLVVVFATGAFVGYLAIGGSTRVAQAKGKVKAPKSTSPPGNVLDEFRGLIERLENRITQHEQKSASQENLPAKVEVGGADPRKSVNVNLSSAFPDVERQLRELVTEIRRAHEAVSQHGATRSTAGSPQDADAAGGMSPDEQRAMDGMTVEEKAAYIERRSRLRHSFLSRQWVAPYNGCRMPGPEEFHYVQCNDISSVGISFFMDADPECQMLVIRLSSPRGPKFLTARVRRVTPNDDSEYGIFTIGCQFLGTIHFDALPPRLNNGIIRREEQGLLEGPKAAAMSSA